jgi:mycothiol synthase
VNTIITWQSQLSPSEAAAVDAMLDRVSEADGVSAMSEQTYLQLWSDENRARHALAMNGDRLLGYAYLSREPQPVAELLVDPDARRSGIGGQLLTEVLEQGGPGVRIWSHGHLPAARALARSAGLRPVRRLCRYLRPLAGLPHRALPDNVEVRRFTAEDADAWLELNAQAFVDLPDQGGWTAADLDERMAQPWFDPAGFLLAFDDRGLAGFHWTKVHRTSPHNPEPRGTGLAAALTVLGCEYLHSLGLSQVMLYVDAANAAAVTMYTRLGFTLADCEVQYATADATDEIVSGTLGA